MFTSRWNISCKPIDPKADKQAQEQSFKMNNYFSIGTFKLYFNLKNIHDLYFFEIQVEMQKLHLIFMNYEKKKEVYSQIV